MTNDSYDFTEQERIHQRLQFYMYDIPKSFENITTLNELSKTLVELGKSKHCPLIDRLIRLILT